MSETPFTLFINLITFDKAFLELEQKHAKLEQEIRVLHEQEKKLQTTLQTAKQAWHDAQKSVDAKELEMASLVQAEGAKKNRLDNVTNHKEYQSIKAEIDTIKSQQAKLESELLEAWASLESTQKAHEHAQVTNKEQREQLQQQLQEKQQQKNTLESEINQKKAERPALEQRVPAEWLEKYATMRSRVSDPVVPVERGSCSACSYQISDPDMQGLARNKLLQCKECYRFLYLPSAHNAPAGNP